MNTLKLLLVLLAFSFSTTLIAQEKKTDSTTIKKHNLLDMQTNILTSVFGENLDGNTTGKSIGYLELLEKTDLSEAQKTEFKNLYYLQAKNLTQKQKDSIGKAIERKIIEAQNTSN